MPDDKTFVSVAVLNLLFEPNITRSVYGICCRSLNSIGKRKVAVPFQRTDGKKYVRTALQKAYSIDEVLEKLDEAYHEDPYANRKHTVWRDNYHHIVETLEEYASM